MTFLKPLLRSVGLVLGGLGLVIGVAAIVVLWMMSARLDGAAATAFSKIDHSLALVRQRLSQSQERVAAAKITAQDVEAALRDWTTQQGARRIESRTQAAQKAERLAAALHQVNNWLEISESSVETMNDVLGVARSAGAPAGDTSADTTLLEELREDLSSLRDVCADATQLADTVHERLVAVSDEDSLEQRVTQAVRLVLRAIATLTALDSRLAQSAERLSVAQGRLLELKSQTRRWILVASIVVTGLLCWMAAGQFALVRLAWKGCGQPGVAAKRSDTT